MSLKNFQKIKTDDEGIMLFQDYVYATINSIVKCPIVDNTVIEDIALVAGVENRVDHKLGRNPVGYIIIKKNAQSDIWDSLSASPALNLSLHCSVNCTVSIYCF